jgi:hypothetical protein
MNKRSLTALGSAAVISLLAAAPADATLTLVDDPVFGPASLVADSTTNLEWLRLNFTQGNHGENQTNVLSQMGPGQQFAGFQVASSDNVSGLMGEFGFPTQPGPPNCFAGFPCGIDPTLEDNVTNLFGISLGDEIGYGYTPLPLSFDSLAFLPGGMMEFNGFSEGCKQGCDLALVRDPPAPPAVPEPGMFGLMLLCFAGLTTYRFTNTERLAWGASRHRVPR